MATRHFFVDESGDCVLFDKKGRSMVGRDGASRFFMVGVAEVRYPIAVARQLEALREELLNDPWCAKAPSLNPARGKTALIFHAKDDLPEVRWEVYKQLRAQDIKVAVAVRDKRVLESQARENYRNTRRKWRIDDIYDALVTRLFTGRLTDGDEHHIAFAARGKANRTAALTQAIENARVCQTTTTGKPCGPPRFAVASDQPSGIIGLQVVDYYLWTIQRLFERAEERFYAGMEPQVECIIDIDNARSLSGESGHRNVEESEIVLTSEGGTAPSRRLG